MLAALPQELIERLLPRMQLVTLTARAVLSEADRSLNVAHFPLSGLCSLIVRFSDGFQAEVGLIGRDGMVGSWVLNGTARPGVEIVVHLGGEALRISGADLQAEIKRAPEVGTVLGRYGEALWAQAMQTAGCNAHHGLEQRLARWLLMVKDRVDDDEVAMTQEALASVLCVHRPSVTVAAQRLQKTGAISYSGGRVAILDRSRLEQCACECYAALQHRNLG